MNASVSFTTAPWSGYAWSPGASALGLKGGGAPTPVLRGSGFSWATIVGPKVGGSVAAYLPNTRGIPMTASFARRYPGGLRGLGQFPTGDTSGDGSVTTLEMGGGYAGGMPGGDGSVTTLQMGGGYAGAPTGVMAVPVTISDAGVKATTRSNPPWYAPILGGATAGAVKITSQYASYANPLYQKSTVALTPQGQVVLATNQPIGATAGRVASDVGSMLPILLIGGLVIMMMRK